MICIRRVIALSLFAFILQPTIALSGELRVVGTGDGVDLLKAVGDAFSAENPGTMVLVPPSIGSGGGIAAVGANKEILARVARPLSPSEAEQGLAYVPFVKQPSAIFVHESAGVSALTSKNLVGIYSGAIKNWKEIGGTDLPIKVVRREDADSTLQGLRKTMPGWADLVITDKSKTAVTTQEAFETVRTTKGGIGFGPYSSQIVADLKVLRIDNKFPTEDGYPSLTTVSFVYKSTNLTPEAINFMKFTRSKKAKDILVKLGGVVFPD